MSSVDKPLLTVWTQIRLDKTSPLNWIQTDLVKLKKKIEKKKKKNQKTKNMQNYPTCKIVKMMFYANLLIMGEIHLTDMSCFAIILQY